MFLLLVKILCFWALYGLLVYLGRRRKLKEMKKEEERLDREEKEMAEERESLISQKMELDRKIEGLQAKEEEIARLTERGWKIQVEMRDLMAELYRRKNEIEKYTFLTNEAVDEGDLEAGRRHSQVGRVQIEEVEAIMADIHRKKAEYDIISNRIDEISESV